MSTNESPSLLLEIRRVGAKVLERPSFQAWISRVDAHDLKDNAPPLGDNYELLARMVGTNTLWAMVEGKPNRDGPPDIIDVESSPPPRLLALGGLALAEDRESSRLRLPFKRPPPREAELAVLRVVPSRRGHGLGMNLYRHILVASDRLRVAAHLPSNFHRGQAFLHKYGFADVPDEAGPDVTSLRLLNRDRTVIDIGASLERRQILEGYKNSHADGEGDD